MKALSISKDCPQCGGNHKSKPFCVYDDGYHCFSCGYHASIDKQFTCKIERSTTDFPDYPEVKYELSVNNKLWLNKYFVDETLIRKFKIVETLDGKLVFSNFQNGNLVCYQTRQNYPERQIRTYGAKEPTLFAVRESQTAVIVEDYISAIRVAEHAHSICLWGTKAPFLFLKDLFEKYEKILVWLDNDTQKEINSGQESAKKICKDLNSILSLKYKKYGFGGITKTEVINIATEKDPKCYSSSELKNILGEHCVISFK